MAVPLLPHNVVISDATVLINFLNSGAFQLLLEVFAGRLHITDLVRSEVIHNDRDLQIAIDEHKVEVHKISLEEIQHLVKSFSNFDEGEASCFKLAKEKNWRVATDDGAAKALVRRELGNLYVVTTFDILLEAVDLGFLTKDQARQLIEDMASKADFQYSNQEFGGFIERLSIK